VNLADSLAVVTMMWGRLVDRHPVSKHLGSKAPKLSKALLRERRKRERQARKAHQRRLRHR
jgi:hypothetical protein